MNQRLGHDVIRFRRTRRAAYALLAVAAAWAALMVFSAFRWFGYVGPGWLADVGDGTLYLMSWPTRGDNYTLRGWHGGPNTEHGTTNATFTWWQWGDTPWRSFGGRPGSPLEGYSIWPLAPLAGTIGMWMLLRLRHERRRRIRLKLCLHCAYQLSDTHTGPCPECGAKGATP